MPTFVIERSVPGVGRMSAEQLHGLAAASNDVLRDLSGAQWVQSFVTQDRIFCVYNADSEDRVREHASTGGFPCDAVHRVSAIIDPVTGER